MFEILSGIATIGYIFIYMIFMNSEKNKLITSFLNLLLSMIFWTLGSLLMRTMFLPSYIFWYHISIMGLLLTVYNYYKFICNFIGKENIKLDRIYQTLLAIIYFINIPSGIILKWPSIINTDGVSSFLYSEITPFVLILIGVTLTIVFNTFYLLITSFVKGTKKSRRQIIPLFIGIFTLAAGNVLVVTPFFKGFPIDILAGVINILFFMYVLVKRRLLRPKMVASENVAYFFSSVIGFLFFFITYDQVLKIMRIETIETNDNTWLLIIIYVFYSLLVHLIWNYVINQVALKDEEFSNDILKEYSSNISKSLDIESIVSNTIETIKNAIGTTNIYIGIIEQGTGNCIIEYSDQKLNGKRYVFEKTSPLIEWIDKTDELENLKEFYMSNKYKKMSTDDSAKLNELGVSHVMGLKDNNILKGIILLTDNNQKNKMTIKEINLISSISTIASVALSEEQFRPLVTQMQLGLSLNEVILDENENVIDYRILSINPSYEKLMSVTKEGIVGKKASVVLPYVNEASIKTCGEVAITGISVQLSTQYNGKYYNNTIYSPKKYQFAVIVEDVTKQKEAEKQIEHLSFHDALTDLYNRRYFEMELERLNQKNNLPLSIIMGDVNKLKYINDKFGHEAGDTLIKKAAEAIKKSCTSEEIIARIGGDEFVIILKNSEGTKAKKLINQINQNLNNIIINDIPLTISFGYDTKTSDNQNIRDILKNADANMFENKTKNKTSKFIDENYVDDRI